MKRFALGINRQERVEWLVLGPLIVCLSPVFFLAWVFDRCCCCGDGME
jgi:hypothetical protein